MKKRFLIFLFVLFVLPSIFLLSGCDLFGGGKVQLSEENVYQIDRITGAQREYTGEEITLDQTQFRFVKNDGKLQGWDQFDYTYSDNINAGQASITITAKDDNDYFTGSLTLHFTITRGVITVSDFEQLKDAVNSKNYRAIQTNGKIVIPEGEELDVDDETWLDFFPTENGHENRGTLIIGQYFSLYRTYLISSGKIIVNGRMSIPTSSILYSSGEIENNGSIELNGKIYTNSEVLGFENNQNCILREKLSDENVSLSSTEVVIEHGKACQPSIQISGTSIWPDVSYENNEHVTKEGQFAYAVVTIKDETNTKYFGQVKLPFKILKGSAKFKNQQELIALQNTGDFCEYTCDDGHNHDLFYINSDFILNEDEVLNASVYVEEGVKLTNKGKIASGLYVSVYGEFVNDGECKVPVKNYATTTNNGSISSSIQNNGQFVNNNDINAYSISIPGGKLTNNSTGTIFSSSLNLSSETELENDGIISSQTSTINGNLTNKNKLSFVSATTFKDAQISNNSNGEIVFNGKTSTNNANFVNFGKITINSDFSLKSNSSVENSNGVVENNGHIWWSTALENVSGGGNVTLRKPLSNAEIILSQTEFDYIPKVSQSPSFTVDGQTLSSELYSLGFKYEGSSWGVGEDNLINAGRINLYITITEDFCDYDSQAVKAYTINKVDCQVSSISKFASAIKDINYLSVKLANDLTISREYESSADCTIDTNGYVLTISANELKCFGNLIVRAVKDPGDEELDMCGVQVLGNGKLSVSNTLELNKEANIYIAPSSATISIGNTLVNNGEIYCHENGYQNNGTTSGEGEIFIRREISSSDVKTSFTNNETVYNGFSQTPIVSVLKQNDENIDSSLFTVDYGESDTLNAGKVNFEVSMNFLLDKNYFGQTSASYLIKRATKEVYSYDELIFDGRNYSKYTLKEGYTLSSNIEIPDDVTLDLGTYDLTFNGYVVNVNESSEIWVTAGTYSRFTKYMYIADKITLAGDLTATNDKLDLEFSGGNYSNNYDGEHYNNLTIDLNGHAFYGQITINVTKATSVNFNVISSSVSKGRIQPSTASTYAVVQKTNNLAAHTNAIAFDNVIVNGLELQGARYCDVEISATNCEFIAPVSNSSNYALKCDDTYSYHLISHFSNCQFTGYTSAHIIGGEHTFDQACIFTATGSDASELVNNKCCGVLFEGKIYDSKASTLIITDCSATTSIGHGVVIINSSFMDYEIEFSYYRSNRSQSQEVYIFS